MAYKLFRRSTTNKVIGGVCGGLGEYFNIDPIIFRLLFVILFFAAGGGLLIYIIMWICTPADSNNSNNNQKQGTEPNFNFSDSDAEVVDEKKMVDNSAAFIGGLILITLGALFFLKNIFHIDFDILWPIIFIIGGVAIIIPALNKNAKIKEKIDSSSNENSSKDDHNGHWM